MRVSVENSGTLERKMSVSVPAEAVEKEVSTRLAKLSKSAKLPGFRPGKVPLKVIEAKFAGQVLNEVAGELIQSSLRDAFQQQELNPAGGPSVEPKAITRGNDLEYVATFEVFPELPPVQIKDEKIEVPVVEISAADIDRTIENVRKQRVEWLKTEDESGEGDQVVINFKGFLDGEVFKGGEGSDFPVVIGGGSILQDLENAVRQRKAGENFEADVNFPEAYDNKELAGKTAQFAIEVISVSKPQLPELDEEFAKIFGVEDGKIESLRGEVRNNLQRELSDRIAETVRQNVLMKLLQNIEFDIPKPLVENEINAMIETNRQQLERQGLPKKSAEIDRSAYAEEAERRVKLGLILHEVIKSEEIKADPALVKTRIESLASSYEQPEAFVKWYYEDKGRLSQIESVVLEQQVVDTLLQSAAQVEKSISFEEFMNPASGADKKADEAEQ